MVCSGAALHVADMDIYLHRQTVCEIIEEYIVILIICETLFLRISFKQSVNLKNKFLFSFYSIRNLHEKRFEGSIATVKFCMELRRHPILTFRCGIGNMSQYYSVGDDLCNLDVLLQLKRTIHLSFINKARNHNHS